MSGDDGKTRMHLPVAGGHEGGQERFAVLAVFVDQPQDHGLIVGVEPGQAGQALADQGPGGGGAGLRGLLQQRTQAGRDLVQLRGLQEGGPGRAGREGRWAAAAEASAGRAASRLRGAGGLPCLSCCEEEDQPG
jgi:hypothetical protein